MKESQHQKSTFVLDKLSLILLTNKIYFIKNFVQKNNDRTGKFRSNLKVCWPINNLAIFSLFFNSLRNFHFEGSHGKPVLICCIKGTCQLPCAWCLKPEICQPGKLDSFSTSICCVKSDNVICQNPWDEDTRPSLPIRNLNKIHSNWMKS